MEWIFNPWPWYVGGPLIVLVMYLLLYSGGQFGVSSNLRTMCSIAGAGKYADFFRFDWKSQQWNLVFVIGGIIGGWIAGQFMSHDDASILLNPKTVLALEQMGFHAIGEQYLPPEIFGWEQFGLKGFSILLIGGFLVGFGTRYAGGCTSGHAISGLSNLQWPSLVAVIGFFIGGLVMTHLLLPLIF